MEKGHSLLPMMRFAPVLGNNCCQTLSGVVVCPLAVSTEQIHARTTTDLCRPVDTPADWRRRPGRPRQSWLRTVETDLRPLNLGLATASDARRTERHGGDSWQRQRRRQAPERRRSRTQKYLHIYNTETKLTFDAVYYS